MECGAFTPGLLGFRVLDASLRFPSRRAVLGREFLRAQSQVGLQFVSRPDCPLRKAEHLAKLAVENDAFAPGVEELIARLAERSLGVVQEPVELSGIEAIVAFCDEIGRRAG